jgi:glycine cleavage system H protein
MDIPEDLRYTKEHEWARFDPKTKILTVGITDYAQEKLGDVVYVELPEEGDQIQSLEPFGSIESVKAVSDLFAPVTGTVVEVNDILFETPAMVNDDPYNEGWMVKVKVDDPDQLEELLNSDDYKELLSSEEE